MRGIQFAGWFLLAAAAVAITACDKIDNFNKNRGPAPSGGSAPPPPDPGTVRHNLEVDKLNQAKHRYKETYGKLVNAWDGMQAEWGGLNAEGRKARINLCLQHAQALDPFYPSGVHPDWATGLRQVKDAWVSYLMAYLEDQDRVFSAGQSGPYWDTIQRSLNDFGEIDNRLTALYNTSAAVHNQTRP